MFGIEHRKHELLEKIIYSTIHWMKTTWISESVGTKVPRLGSQMTSPEQNWYMAVSKLFLTYLNFAANCWIFSTKNHVNMFQNRE